MDLKSMLLSFEGRINRQPYWMFVLAMIGLGIILAIATFALPLEMRMVIQVIYSLAIIWPALAMQAKRWHDRDKSAWWILINLIPFIGPLWALIECGFLRGTPGNNRFGADPLAAAAVTGPASSSPPPVRRA